MAWFGSEGRKRGGQPGPLLLLAHSLNRSQEIPPALHPHIFTEPQDTLPASPVPGSTSSPTLIPDGDRVPTQRLGVLRASHPRGRKAPAHRGIQRHPEGSWRVFLLPV